VGKYLREQKYILFDVKDRVARIILNKPEKRNALEEGILTELQNALLESDALNDVNVVILQGAGKDFCAGYDLVGAYSDGWSEQDYRQRSGLDNDAWYLESNQRLTMTIFDMHKPVIARVHGNCLAGGADIALMCDFVIAAEDARIGFPATRANGTPPNNFWIYHVGPQWAKRLIMTGDSILGKHAARIGLVLDAVPAEQLDDSVNELARRLSFVDGELLSAHKRVLNMAMELMGARTLQRFAAESDARAHMSTGPRRQQFKQDMDKKDFKTALKNRDAPFGDGMVKAHWLQQDGE
jgi:enoyl-CoA hydratase